MKYKIISCLFFGCCTLSIYAKPMLPSSQINTNYEALYTSLSPFQDKKLNIKPPLLLQENTIQQSNKKLITDSALILASAKKSSPINFLVLSASKNAVLKAVVKKKSYGLRYTRIW